MRVARPILAGMRGAQGPGRAPEEIARASITDAAVRRTIIESSIAGERIVSVARLAFCLVSLIRSTHFQLAFGGDHNVERACIGYPGLAIATGLSIAVLAGLGARRRTGLVIHASVAVDIAAMFAALLPNALWAAPSYIGAPFLIDTAGILVVTMAAGLRQSVSASILASVLGALSLAGLAIADHAVGVAAFDLLRGYSMYGLLLASVAAISLIVAVRARRLVSRAVGAAIAADHAARALRSVLHDHHDLRATIASARINADLLVRTLGGRDVPQPAGHLLEDLAEIGAQVEQVKVRALAQIAESEGCCAVSVGPMIDEVVSALALRFQATAVRASHGRDLTALVAGGAPTLRRILTNLALNACEGDGARAAGSVDVRAWASGPRQISIEIVDDGPGFPAEVLSAPAGGAPSTKRAGTGVGLEVVDALVQASGGRCRCDNLACGGGRFVVELLAAPPSPV